MKPIIIPVIAVLVTFGLSMIITRLIYRKRRREGRLTRRRRIVTFILILLFIHPLSALIYFNTYSRATDHAMEFMNSTALVKVSEVDTGYFFDGPGTRDALVFYPGGMVDEKAYAELMHLLAESGVDCFLVKMPLHLAIFGRTKADDVIDAYSYERWYVGGHSLGGAMAAAYACMRPERLEGLIMLAGYSVDKIPDTLSVLSITATEDHVLHWDDFEANKGNLPPATTRLSIEGGNHSQFGDYGLQTGDGTATISRDEQMEQVRDIVVEYTGN